MSTHIIINSIFLQIQATSSAVIETQGPPTEEGLSVLTLLLKGGPIMIPILLLSILAIYIFVERFLYIRKASKLDADFLTIIKDKLYSGNVKAALAFCSESQYTIAKLIGKALLRMGSPVRDIESAMENSAKVEIYKMERGLTVLGAVAAIAPMFGFLGTVMGMIKAFYNMSQANDLNISIIAGGMYEKMITSASGLIVGVMAYILYTYLSSMIDAAVNKMEMASADFLDLLHKPIA